MTSTLIINKEDLIQIPNFDAKVKEMLNKFPNPTPKQVEWANKTIRKYQATEKLLDELPMSNFSVSLIKWFDEKGFLTLKQIDTVNKILNS